MDNDSVNRHSLDTQLSDIGRRFSLEFPNSKAGILSINVNFSEYAIRSGYLGALYNGIMW